MGIMVDSCINIIKICEKPANKENIFVKNVEEKESETNEELLDENYRLELIKKEAKKCFPIPSDTKSLKNRATLIIQNKIDPWSVYKEIEEIGSGPYGLVKKVYLRKQPNIIRALKLISKEQLIEGMDNEKLLDEIIILKNLEHPNLVKIYDFFDDEKNYYIATDFYEEGDLLENVTKINWTNEDIFKSIMEQIFTALTFLHSKNVLHGDIRLANIMLQKITKSSNNKFNYDENIQNNTTLKSDILNGSVDYRIKLKNYGYSTIFKKNKEKKSSIIYSSPDIIDNLKDEKCDEWSCGVLMYFLLFGEPPFKGENEEIIFKKIKNDELKYPQLEYINKDCIDLIKKLLEKKISKRIKANDALNHPFFSESNENEEIEDNTSIKSN
jgi:calcium-dependent protein kinase